MGVTKSLFANVLISDMDTALPMGIEPYALGKVVNQ